MFSPVFRVIRSAMLVAILAGCASSTQSSAGTPNAAGQITITDAQRSRFANALELVQHSRAEWLRARGTPSLMLTSSVKVYVDNRLRGNASRLQEISLHDVERLIYLDSREATMRFGTDNVSGAILVVPRQ
jgi:hypothetical protein